jgi:hypothetical protein
VEIVLAAAAGVAAFVVAALVSAAARPHVPPVLVGPLLLLAVLAVTRFAGILYALPVGVATILAFDWYLLPPLRDLDAATVSGDVGHRRGIRHHDQPPRDRLRAGTRCHCRGAVGPAAGGDVGRPGGTAG